jgi:hypothetical protein
VNPMKRSPAFALSGCMALSLAVLSIVPNAPMVAATVTIPTTVKMAWIFDSHVPTGALEADEVAENVGYVWGATAPEVPGGPAIHDAYVDWQQGYCPGGGYSLTCPSGQPPSYPWLEKNHPDWVFWQVNSKGKPTVIAHGAGDPGPIVDFTNPSVRSFWFKTYIAPALRAGFDGVSWDHSTPYNSYGAAGHFNARHRFVRQFTGYTEDPGYAKAEANALNKFLQMARAVKASAAFTTTVFDSCTERHTASWYAPLKYVQTVFDEAGYTNWGDKKYPWLTASSGPACRNEWLAKTKRYIFLQKQGKSVVLVNEIPMNLTPDETDNNPQVRALMQWALANYFLVKSTHTYFWFGTRQAYGYPAVMQPEELVTLGSASGPMHAESCAYVRTYTQGMAVVNPSPHRACRVVFPSGKYKDLYGHHLNASTLGPHTGLVLQVVN